MKVSQKLGKAELEHCQTQIRKGLKMIKYENNLKLTWIMFIRWISEGVNIERTEVVIIIT